MVLFFGLTDRAHLQVDHLYVVSDHSVIAQYQRYWLLFNEALEIILLIWLVHELLAGFILYTRPCKLSQHYFAHILSDQFWFENLLFTFDLNFSSVMRETQYFQISYDLKN